MSEFQKIIKYIAIFIAIGLATFIIGIILSVTLGLGYATHIVNNYSNDYRNDTDESDEMQIPDFSLFDDSYSQEYENINSINVSNGIAKLNIYQNDSDKVKVTAQNIDSKFQCVSQNNTLTISYYKDKQSLKNKSDKEATINIYVPKTQKLSSVKLDSSIGDINIFNLNAKDIDISSNIGKIAAQNVSADNSKISGGTGNIVIGNSTLNDLNLDMGIGNINIDGKITGNSKINGGLGELSLIIDGKKGDYNILNSGGIGKLTVDGNISDSIIHQKEDADYLSMPKDNNIEISLGVGNIKINFKNN